jgi:glutamate carboxypeptidase
MNEKLNYNRYFQELKRIVNMDSPSNYPEGNARVARFLHERFADMGWHTIQHEFDPSIGPCLEVRNTQSSKIDFLLIGHIDTVFPRGTCNDWPYTTKGNRAFGPGVGDMKSGSLLIYHVLSSLFKCGELTNISVCAAFNCDEEIGSRYSRPWLEALAQKSRRVLVLEGARADGSLVNERKGVGRYFVDFSGVAAHAGVEPEKGRSAIVEMAHWIVALDSLNNFEIGTTVNTGVVSGGTVPNMVADRASAKIDLRFKAPSEAVRVDKAIRELAANPKVPGVIARVDGGVTRPPMIPSEKTLKLCRDIEIVGAELGIPINWTSTGGGSDGNFSAALGIPTIDGLGPRSGRAHSPDEYMEIDSVEPHFRLLLEIIRRM